MPKCVRTTVAVVYGISLESVSTSHRIDICSGFNGYRSLHQEQKVNCNNLHSECMPTIYCNWRNVLMSWTLTEQCDPKFISDLFTKSIFFCLIKSKQIHQRKIDDSTIFFAFELSSVNPSHAGYRNRFDDLCNYRCLRIVLTVLCSYSITRQIDCHSDTRNNLDQKSSFPSVEPLFGYRFIFFFIFSVLIFEVALMNHKFKNHISIAEREKSKCACG